MKIKTLKVEQNRVVYHSTVSNEYLQGSSLFLSTGDGIEYKKRIDILKNEVKDGYEIHCLELLGAEKTDKYFGTRIPRKRENAGYKLNKQKVRGKVSAFFDLRQSKKFCAFYSISFPSQIEEKEAVKAFNTWRTRLSKLGLKSFIRVCEHQKNGTIHFHMLTNNFLNIKTVNYMMGKVLENMGILKRAGLELKQYNGVDVRYVRNGRDLGAYLTKYVTKNNEVFEVLPYHSSRDVSALFYCYSLPAGDVRRKDIEAFLSLAPSLVFETDYASVEYYGIKNGKCLHLSERLKSDLIETNQMIYDCLPAGVFCNEYFQPYN